MDLFVDLLYFFAVWTIASFVICAAVCLLVATGRFLADMKNRLTLRLKSRIL